MLNYRKGRRALRHLLLMSVLWTAGCTKEDMSDCQTAILLDIRAYAYVGGADVSTDVNDVILYLFDEDNQFVRQIETTTGSYVPLDILKGESVTIIAWGNLMGGHETYSVLNGGDPMDSGYVKLMNAHSAPGQSVSPDDLFHGVLTLNKSDMAAHKEISIYRKTGRMVITVKGWQSYFPDVAPDDISILIGDTYNSLSFAGVFQGDKVSYSPSGILDASNNFYVAPFMMFPGDNLSITVNAPGYTPITIRQDKNGLALSVVAGETTNVLLDLRVSMSVSVDVTPWGTETIWKDF